MAVFLMCINIKSEVAPSEANASVVKFDGIELQPLLLLSSTDDLFFSCESIEHIRSYLSVFAFLIYFSNTVPCNFVQIDVLYQGPSVIRSRSCFVNIKFQLLVFFNYP